MRRLAALVLTLSLVAVGCSDGDGDDDEIATPTTTSSSAPTSTTEAQDEVTTTTAAVEHDPSCTPGAVLDGGEITYVTGDGRVVGVAPDGSGERCLADGQPDGGAVRWNGTGANAILPSGDVVLGDGGIAPPVPEPATWSAPTGTSLIWLDDDPRLFKRGRDEREPLEITFTGETEEALYHPAGRAIVAVGEGPFDYGIYLGTNDGLYLRELVIGETAERISQLTWTRSGALMFVGDHGAHSHVHRLDLSSGELGTMAEVDGAAITGLTASPFDTGGVAWRAGDDLVITRDGADLPVPDEVRRATPAGWLEGGALAVLVDGGDVAVVDDGVATVVGRDAVSVSVRAVQPPPPELPSTIPLQAPA